MTVRKYGNTVAYPQWVQRNTKAARWSSANSYQESVAVDRETGGHFFHHVVQGLFVAGLVGNVLPHHFAVAVHHKGVRRVGNVHRAFEIFVRVQVYFVFPAAAFYHGAYLGGVARVVNGNGNELYARGGHPFLVLVGNGAQFQHAGFAPRGPKIDDHRLAVVAELIRLYGVAVDVFHRNGRKLERVLGTGADAQAQQEKKEEVLHIACVNKIESQIYRVCRYPRTPDRYLTLFRLVRQQSTDLMDNGRSHVRQNTSQTAGGNINRPLFAV